MLRRARISFETPPALLPDALPRMDVAAFVGFARSGPVDVPVPVEDMQRFRDLFGEDQPLAWDSERGAMEFGHLGSAVDAFFAGGGRRAWIVRVAHAPYTHRFPLPGVSPARGNAPPTPTCLQARSPGHWAQDLRVGTKLIAQSAEARLGDSDGPSVDPSGIVIHPVSVNLGVAPGAIQRGDLIELRFLPMDLMLFLVADSVVAIDRGLRVTALDDPQPQWAWAVPTTSSPPSDDQRELYPVVEQLDGAAGESQLAAWRALPDSDRALRARRLTFEITAWREGRLTHRIGELAFSPRHPRYFGNLPTDEQLFFTTLRMRSDGRDREETALRAEASGDYEGSAGMAGGRFPFAGPPCPDVATDSPLLLPCGMDLGRNLRYTIEALTLGQPPPALEQDGIARLEQAPFFDARLQDYSRDNLLTTAQTLHNIAREWDQRRSSSRPLRLRGLHAVLPVDEATLLAIPDAVHRPWSPAGPKVPDLPAAPQLHELDGHAQAGRLNVTWTSDEKAATYELQWDEEPEFAAPVTAYRGPSRATHIALPRSCSPQRFLRVRAFRDGQPSPWSNTRVLRTAFLPCGQEELPELILAASPAASPGRVALSWTAERAGQSLAASLRYRIEIAYNALVDSPEVYALPPHTQQLEIEPRGALRYCRVRAELGSHAGPWSNTVMLPPGDLNLPRLTPRPEPGHAYDDSVLLAVHRAAVRFCAARGDLLALLTLPRHYGRQDVGSYLAALTPDDTSKDTESRDRSTFGRLRLSEGESSALSYAALYHPWVARERLGRAPVFEPPDGAAAGVLANAALEQGVWTSTANRPIPAVLGVDPDLTESEVESLLALQVNVLRRAPRGFLLADDQTLSRDHELRPTGVRRLLVLLRRLALREGNAYVFEPLVPEFADRVRHRFERVLSALHVRGAFLGQEADDAFRVVTDATVNTPQSLDLGRFVVELRVAPSRPLAFLRVRLLQRGPQDLLVSEV